MQHRRGQLQHRRGQWQYRTQDIVDSSQEIQGRQGSAGHGRAGQCRKQQGWARQDRAFQQIQREVRASWGRAAQGRTGQNWALQQTERQGRALWSRAEQKLTSAIPVDKHQAPALCSAGQLSASGSPCVSCTEQTLTALP